MTRYALTPGLEGPAYTAGLHGLIFMLRLLIGKLVAFDGLLKKLGDQAGPAGLMAGANAPAVVAVEILVEQDQVAPVRIALEPLVLAVHRTPPVLITHEDVRQ